MPESHYPECWAASSPTSRKADCICDRLRACEQRVAAETISRLDRWQQHSPLGRKTYEEGVQAARDAVKALEYDGPYCKVVHSCEALDAIDALRGDDR